MHLGVAFQATDDLLDIEGDSDATGKELFADLREGKMTWPVIAGLGRDPSLRTLVERGLESGTDLPELARRIEASLRQTGALDDCRSMARQRVSAGGRQPHRASARAGTRCARRRGPGGGGANALMANSSEKCRQ